MPELQTRKLRTPEEFRMAEEVQVKAWGMRSEHPVPASLQRAIQDNGGLILGAFHDIHLVGFNLAFVAWDGQELYYWSHMNAVLPEYQNHGVGLRLKKAQREEVVKAGLSKVRWTFDPLIAKNANLNVRKLGAYPDRYMHHYYGAMDTEQTGGIPTDRVRVTWLLNSPHVEERLQGKIPSKEEDQERHGASQVLLTTDLGEAGLRIPREVHEPESDKTSAVLEVPFDLSALREHQPQDLKGWRQATREAFRAAHDLGWGVDDFAIVNVDHERRAFYFLAPRPPESATSEPSVAP
ncbi:MAG: GNAT family N-acetyltransferase [Euryarchaeota archaeon]|nr:GNAT family N-acetyltransferase [Euryarchaeota archaeon]